MPQSLAKMIAHVIFSTKHRRPYITPEVKEDLQSYLGGSLKGLDSSPIEINCVSDHAHILCCVSRNISVAELVAEIKKASSKWIKTRGPAFGDFYWQGGYGSFSVSQSNVASVRRYIRDQAAHHRTRTFQEEFRAFLDRHQIEYDERYVWD